MTIQGLLRNTPFDEVWEVLISRFDISTDDAERAREAYHHAYLQLCTLDAEAENDKHYYLIVCEFEDTFDDSDVTNLVCEYYCLEDKERYGMELCPWSKIVASGVCELSLNEYGSAIFCAAALYEITFLGYSEERCAVRRNEIHESIKQGMQEMELGNFLSADEVFAELHSKFGITDERTEEEKALASERSAQKHARNQAELKRYIDSLICS